MDECTCDCRCPKCTEPKPPPTDKSWLEMEDQ